MFSILLMTYNNDEFTRMVNILSLSIQAPHFQRAACMERPVHEEVHVQECTHVDHIPWQGDVHVKNKL
jgi:hypothetical protein